MKSLGSYYFRKSTFLISLFCLSLIIFCSSCALIKARPAADSGFLPHPELLMSQNERAPFHGYWVDDPQDYEKTRFELAKVYIAPIDSSYVAAMYQAASGSESTKIERIEEAQELARYFQEKIKLVLRNNKDAKLHPVENSGPGILTLRLALVQVVPTNPGVNLLGTAAGAFVPGGGLIKTFGEGSIAMEGLVEENNGHIKVREEYKDRQGQKVSLFTLKDYQRYAHIRVALDDWTAQITDLLNSPHDVKIEGANLVSLNPF